MPDAGSRRAAAIRAGDWLALSARRFPHRTCLVDEGEGASFSFAEANARVNRLANALLGAGVAKGDTATILALDSHRYMETLLAAMKIGATYVPLNYRLAEPEVQTLLGAARTRWIFVSERYAATAARLHASDGQALRVVCFGGPTEGAEGYEDLLATADDDEPQIEVDDEDILGLAFTSGTTGLPNSGAARTCTRSRSRPSSPSTRRCATSR